MRYTAITINFDQFRIFIFSLCAAKVAAGVQQFPREDDDDDDEAAVNRQQILIFGNIDRRRGRGTREIEFFFRALAEDCSNRVHNIA